MTSPGPSIGRSAESARVRALLPPVSGGAQVLVVVGGAGIGKTSLLEAAVAEAGERGVRVLRVRGSAAETELAFAGLHQLLRPVLDAVDDLPERQREVLRAAFGYDGSAEPGDGMALSLAVLTLLSTLADAGPLLLVVDDAQWVDRATVDVLAFLARRLEGEPISLLVLARGDCPPAGFDLDVPVLTVPPLAPEAAEAVLDAQPVPPKGLLRKRILTLAEGNPLALAELAKAAAIDGRAGWEHEELPVTERIERTFAADLPALPADTRRALLVAAAADTTDLAIVLGVLPGAGLDVWLPAERAGLLRLGHGELEFRHPLVRSAVYYAATPDERRAAHLALARVHDPDRRAWHLSAATVTPDETVAAALEETANRARGRGATVESMAAFERAAYLSPDPVDHGNRLAKSAVTAIVAGDLARAAELAARARSRTADPAASAWLSVLAGTVASVTLRLRHAITLVLPVTESLPPDQEVTLHTLTIAANIAHYTGDPDHLAAVRRVYERCHVDSPAAVPFQSWIAAVVDPFGNAAHGRAGLAGIDGLPRDPVLLNLLGALAMLLDETETAVRLLVELADPVRPDAEVVQLGMAAADLGWAWFAAGRWADARRAVEGLARRVGTAGPTLATVRARALMKTLSALSGSGAGEVAELLAITEPADALAVTVRAHYAAGMAAVADGDHELAYTTLRALFDADGHPVHYHFSYYAIADLAAAAARTDQVSEVTGILKLARERLSGAASTRLDLILHRAGAQLADDPEPHFAAALADPEGERWPFERALAQLDSGEWLRRNRRIAEARIALAAALPVFERLGARPWADRARTELRASGVAVAPGGADLLDVLTPQQRQIVRLAADGLTNREIGERMFLSHRTVSFHLYQAFPKLGVTARAQLGQILAQRASSTR
ncbi:AAA family ATPase [Actinokineospora sp. NBRC 105648]|uniref:AAA family ATPase n=1 Tax=Actinokineospora sp. NBRC 105648 TaxID=3032206 RepID=UPI0024A20164|nr:AAA family ATPase [Actinokineospora sp. NBRC 105648]GLZ39572.1 transcriptional regulator [Actinokineospora sp. NBRC 105648]